MEIPSLWENAGLTGLDGIIWFQKEIELEAQDILNDLEVYLGTIDDSDITYFNGVKIGETTQKYNESRMYKVEKSMLKKGKNSIVVRVEDTGGGGGIYGASDQLFISLPNKKISLAGQWKYMIGKGDFSYSIGPNSMPSLLFNAMIHPLLPFGIKGAIWYQGESNAGRAYEYRTLFPTMITNWRDVWGQGNFPFLFVQLANFMQPKEQPGASTWAELREAQTMTLSLPNTGMATIIDIGEADDIHPRNKLDVGKRLAMSALKVAYGKNVVASGPTYRDMRIEGNKVFLSFDNLGTGFYLKDRYGYVKGFSVAGKDQVFHWAKAEITGENIVLTCDGVDNPVAVRYGWADNPDDLNLYNLEGLPAVPFRTDNWPGITEGNTYRGGSN
jgi:sialate O-acetylesterase